MGLGKGCLPPPKADQAEPEMPPPWGVLPVFLGAPLQGPTQKSQCFSRVSGCVELT